jgi:membrane protease YdiL (CAAX protease family)
MTPATPTPAEFSPWLALLGFFFFAFFVASLVTWIGCLVRRKQILAWTGWRFDQPNSRIGLIDLVAFFCCILISQFVALSALRPWIRNGSDKLPELSIPPSDAVDAIEVAKAFEMPAWLAPVLAISYLLAVLFSVGLLTYRTGAPLRKLGLTSNEFSRDVGVGLLVFLLATPVILIFSGILNSATKIEYEHPVIDSMRQHPWTFPFLFLGAVLCAPLWEEYAFRGLLIRWLDSIRSSGGDLRTVLLGRGDSSSLAVLENDSFAEQEPRHVEHESLSNNPYLILIGSNAGEVANATVAGAFPPAEKYPPWWPAMVSGILFGLAHFAYGISWLPLILFGTILGRLFQLRRSIVPCMVVHACFNALSMIGLAAQVFSAK